MQPGGLQVLATTGHTDVDDQRMMVEMAGGATLSLVYENLLKEGVPNLTENSIVILIVCGGTLLLQNVLKAGSAVSVESLMAFKQKYGQP
jgi:hypothetical protein